MRFRLADLNSEQIRLFRKLTKLQQGVVRGVLSGLTYSEAHKRAGGDGKNDETRRAVVCAMLTDPNVKAFMEAFQPILDQAIIDDVNGMIMTREEMAQSLTSIARSNLADVVDLFPAKFNEETGELVTPATWSLKQPEQMTNAGMNLISELTAGKDGVKIKTHSKLAAMKQLAELLGYDDPKRVEHSGGVTQIEQIQIVAPDVDPED